MKPSAFTASTIITAIGFCREGAIIEVLNGTEPDIESWMKLVSKVSSDFPGLETEEKIEEHGKTVLEFISKRQALCVKDDERIIGVILFSTSDNMICFLAVDPEYRNRGIASALLETAISKLDRTADIAVTTFRSNDDKGKAPRALYKKYGFAEDKLMEEFGYPNQLFLLHPQTAD